MLNRVKTILQDQRVKEFIRFVVVGILATAIHYAVYLLLLYLIATNIAYVVGYLVSFCVNFYCSARFTFQSSVSFRKVLGFALSHLINLGLHVTLLNLFIQLGLNEQIAPIPVFMIAIPVNFILVRFVFKSKLFN
ncbi:MAG: GtrA family protein [Rikenellaceae bacterium]